MMNNVLAVVRAKSVAAGGELAGESFDVNVFAWFEGADRSIASWRAGGYPGSRAESA